MSNAESSPNGVSDDSVAKAEQSFDTFKDAVERCRINRRMVQSVRLIWLDGNIDENNADCHDTMDQLRRTVNTIDTYTDDEQCIEFMKTMEDEKVCMVISNYFGQQFVPRVHDMSQVDSIFILCANNKCHEEWTKEWLKIKGVFTEISSICEALKKAAQRCEQNAIPMSFMATSGDLSKKKLNQLDPSFMYTQLLKEILLEIQFEKKHFTEFIEYCREVFDKNPHELKYITKLERTYPDQPPILWYTLNCFLYPMLNCSLRLMNVDIMIKIGFFIGDLHRDIYRMQQEQYGAQNSGESFIVYRGQGMSKIEFDKMSQSLGGLLSFNSFLSTSKNQNVSLKFADDAVRNPDSVGVLFVMTIDPSQCTTPFASIAEISCYKDQEDEVLFGMHTVFRINNIKPMDGNHQLYQVDLTLTNNNDKDLQQLTDRIRQETEGSSGWDQLGELLLKIGKPEKAEQIYNMLLDQTTEEIDKAHIYRRIGWAKDDQAEHQKALTYFEKALAIREQSLPPNHPDLCHLYSDIGSLYSDMGEYSKALLYHEKELAIREQSLPPNHPDLATSYNNIGLLYSDIDEYSTALSYHEKALTIREQLLPPNHPDLATSYYNIGLVYFHMSEYSTALSYHEKALTIREQSLPLNHPDLASSYTNTGNVYADMGEYSKALLLYERSLAIKQQSLPPNHPRLASSYNNISLVYSDMDEYSKALKFAEDAVKIGEQSLPLDHPGMKRYKSNLSIIKNKLEFI